MKRYLVLYLCSLFLFQAAAVFAKDGTDSLNLPQSVFHRNKNYTGSTSAIGLANYRSSTTAAPKRTWFRAMRYSGWARTYVMYRSMDTYYDIPPTEGLSLPVSLSVGDGYQQPMMLFRLEGSPSAKTAFTTEIQFDHLFFRKNSKISDDYGRYANLFVLFNLSGSVETKYGKFRMTAGGGANWFRLSPFSLWGYQYRDDMFERYPWEPEGHDFNRYNSYYSTGDIPRDQRFGMVATQGVILDVTNMPGNLEVALLYGKTSNSSYEVFKRRDPINMAAGRISKKMGDHKIGFNYFNQYGYNDSIVKYKVAKVEGTDTFYVDDNRVSSLNMTVDGRFVFKNFSIYTELGGGSYYSNTYNSGLRDNAKAGIENAKTYKRDWDESLFLEITTKRRLTFLPLKVGFYRIGALVVNNTNNVANTSVEQAKPNPATPNEYYTNYFDGMITELGQLANNRQGINLSTSKEFFYNKLKTKLGLGASQEIVNLAGDMRNGGRAEFAAGAGADSLTKVPFTNSISYEHKLNALNRSRFGFYKRFQGPYERLHSFFRRNFENVAITDTFIDYKKSFNTIDLELKYKMKLFGKELILSNFADYSSVQDYFSPIPVFSDKAFIRYFYEEFMAFYGIHQKVTLVGFFGYERVLGNQRVEVADANGNRITDANGRPIADPNGKTLNQVGHGYGAGIDYNFHSRASLNIRNRWYDHKDKSFTLDRFKGFETTVEFKVFF